MLINKAIINLSLPEQRRVTQLGIYYFLHHLLILTEDVTSDI